MAEENKWRMTVECRR